MVKSITSRTLLRTIKGICSIENHTVALRSLTDNGVWKSRRNKPEVLIYFRPIVHYTIYGM